MRIIVYFAVEVVIVAICLLGVVAWEESAATLARPKVPPSSLKQSALPVSDPDIVPAPRMRLFSRPARLRKPFVVLAAIKGADGQSVQLDLPPELELVGDLGASQPVKTAAGQPFARVSWVVVAPQEGTFKIRATLTDGTVADEVIRVYCSTGLE